MTTLPLARMILYKHGVGYFERRGPLSGTTLRLTFPRPAMDDVLKSLVALDMGAGHVLGVDFETPEDRAALLAKGSIHLSDTHSLRDLLRDLRGRTVRCTLHDDPAQTVAGLVVGVDYDPHAPDALAHAQVSLYDPEAQQVRPLSLAAITNLALEDPTAAADLSYFLRAAQSEEDRRSATVHLSPGEHDLLVGYLAPAPAWRVSYRLLYEAPTDGAPVVLLQGWGLFDNQLEEDLHGVRLTLVAGMPVSFRYRLYEPHTPERPLIADEERTVNAPVLFESAPPPAPAPQAARRSTQTFGLAADAAAADEPEVAFAMDAVADSVQAAASGSERGALFAYEVSHPVSVARGQSAMVPILSQRLGCRRELLYNGSKLPRHPIASLRLENTTGLTLERGPVTVLEDGAYAGEAMVPFTRTGGELLVSYAVELGITVDEQRSRTRQIVSLSLHEDYLRVDEYETQQTAYHLRSTLSEPTEVLIEHTRTPGYDLTDDQPAPQEATVTFARWPVACAPQAATSFALHERRLRSRREHVRSLTGQHLEAFLQDKLLDTSTVHALRGVLAIYQQIGQLQQRTRQIEREREAIFKQQRQIQGNLGPLGREGDEGTLRARYVANLAMLEDQLAALQAEERQLHEQIAAQEAEAQRRLRALQE